MNLNVLWLLLTGTLLLGVVSSARANGGADPEQAAPDSPAGVKQDTAEEVFAGLREFYRKTGRADGSFQPGADPRPVFDAVLQANYRTLPPYMTSFFPLALASLPSPTAALPLRPLGALVYLVAALTRPAFADPAAAPLPAGVKAVWDAAKANRQTTPTRERICLNGLWQWQAAEARSEQVPTGNWGYFKVPGSWPGISDYMQKDCQSVFAHPAWKDVKLAGVRALSAASATLFDRLLADHGAH